MSPSLIAYRHAREHGRTIGAMVSVRLALQARADYRARARSCRTVPVMRAHFLGVARGFGDTIAD